METTDISKNVSFTGHRSGRISQPMLTLFAGMVTEIKSLYASGCRNFFSGMAEGGDLVFAKAVLAARNELTDIRLVAAIPFRSGETCGNHARLLGRTTLWRHILYGKESYRSR